MTDPEQPPAPIALLIGLSRARHALQRARSLPGMPLLTLGRRVRAAGGARGPDGELPWPAGATPPLHHDDPPAPPSPAIARTVSPWPHVGQERHDPEPAQTPPAIRPPQRPTAASPAEAASTRREPAPEPAPPAERRPPPLVIRTATAPGPVSAARQTRPPLPALPPSPGAPAALPYASPQSVTAASSPDAPSPLAAHIAIHATPSRHAAQVTAPPSPPAPAARPTAKPQPLTPRRATSAAPAFPQTERRWPTTEPSSTPPLAQALPLPPHLPNPAPAPAPPLVQYASHATPASVSTVLALGENIQQAVRQELDEMRAIVTRIGKQAAPPAPAAVPPPPAATGDAARHLLGRMRTMLQEEQFRRGNLR